VTREPSSKPMPIKSVIIPAERLVLTRSWGVVTFEEVVAHQDGLLSNPEFNPDYDQLGIHTDVELASGTGAQAQIVARRRIFSTNSFRAHVAKRDDVYGLLRMIATYAELEIGHENVQAFRDEQSAREWLSKMRAEREASLGH